MSTNQESNKTAAWLTMQDVCARTKLSRNTVRKLRDRGEIPMVKVGGCWRITEAAFQRAERAIFERRPRKR